MANTLISDILKPDVWRDYGVQRTMELSALWQSGIVASVPNIVLPSGGGTVNLPFFSDLDGDAENLSDSTPLTPDNISANKDVAAVIGRGKAWSVNDLAGVLSGADPFKAVLDLIASFWARNQQRELINMLNGAFSAASMAGNVHNISGADGAAAVIGADTTVDAAFKLGDAHGQLRALAVHSSTLAKLVKDDLIEFSKPSGAAMEIPYYMGKQVITDDGLPVSGGVYTSYLFGSGAIGYVEDVIGDKDIETDRDILAGDTVAAMRRRFMLHPRGIKWTGAPAGAFPSRAELATGANWTRVYENKAIRVIQFKHKLA